MKPNIACITAFIVTTLYALCPCDSLALGQNHFATSSKLSQGRWVKIAVSQTGVTQITSQELSEMGFGSPESVRVFGRGGNMMGEALNGNAPDDLQQVPTQVIDGKLCFWACGPVAMSIADASTSTPRFTRTVNAYSNYGYYFLTQDAGSTLSMKQAPAGNGTESRSASLDYMLHERELRSLSETGKDLLGEEIAAGEGCTFSFSLPELVPGTPIVVNPQVAATSTDSVYVTADLSMGGHTQPLEFTLRSTAIPPINESRKTYIFYYTASPVASIVPDSSATNGSLTLRINDPDQGLSSSHLDYFIITYTHRNKLPEGQAQMRLGLANLSSQERIALADSGLVVWNVDTPEAPVQYTVVSDSTGWSFSPNMTSQWAKFVAFNPADTLHGIASWSEVANQNIHGDSVPDMVIVTCKAFLEQAKRIAHLHQQQDRMKVSIYDQELIFNEFSGGTPDAMGIRLMNKMFYDRDTESRFRYMLILGCGSYDNRGIICDKDNRVITYQTDASNDETTSYTCDDFFGMLDDNSGSNISSDLLRLGIGRIPSATEEECKSDIDKLLLYANDPDYGVWRNNMFIASDWGDRDTHRFQAEGIAEIVSKDYTSGMMINRDYIGMFPFASELAEPSNETDLRTATGCRSYMAQQLKSGQYLATYVGHANPFSFTHDNHMWDIPDVESNTYAHMPIMTTATCDVARYDSDTRGIAELMFHKTDGGAIALLSSARTVFANSNDRLNRAFIEALFEQTHSSSKVVRLGDAYIQCKQVFGKVSDHSKMSFLLLGDPAMRVNLPKPLFKVTKINGTDVASDPSAIVSTMPMREITIEAKVYDKNDTAYVDHYFNGLATISLYDKADTYTTATGTVNNRSTTRTIIYPRPLLAQVTDSVVGGVLSTKLLVPRYVKAVEQECLLVVYAHKTGTDQMVSGQYEHLKVKYYQQGRDAITDTEAPVIEKMYLNSEAPSADGALMPTNPTLYVVATDDHAVSTQENYAGASLSLTLDGGASTYNEVAAYSQVTDGGKSMTVAMPLSGLTTGQHTLTITVPDAAGNVATRAISFSVQADPQIELYTEEGDVAESEVNFMINTLAELSEHPTVTVTVTDAAGRMLWHKTTSEFPLRWNLRSGRTQRVPAGVYHYSASYTAGQGEHGGTAVRRLIVIDPHK